MQAGKLREEHFEVAEARGTPEDQFRSRSRESGVHNGKAARCLRA